MVTLNKEVAIQKITEMSTERVSKVLIFMAGMEAEKALINGVNRDTSGTKLAGSIENRN